MQKLKICKLELTFGEGCDLYIQYCRQRNLRAATIEHYRQSCNQFFKFFSADLPLNQFNQTMYNDYIVYLKERLTNDVSINSYLRDLITILHYLMSNEYLTPFKMQSIKVDKAPVETYTDRELQNLLSKPDIKTCSFIDYESWVITCLLFSTGIRQHSLMELKVGDIDFDNGFLNVKITKTRKPLLLPLNNSIVNILSEFLRHRQHHNKDDWLFCNAYGQKLLKSTCYNMLYRYNKQRNVQTTGLHRYRHTFAKQWILNGGNVVTLSRLLGHSSLATTQNYLNLLVSDISKQVDDINLLAKFTGKKKFIKMKK